MAGGGIEVTRAARSRGDWDDLGELDRAVFVSTSRSIVRARNMRARRTRQIRAALCRRRSRPTGLEQAVRTCEIHHLAEQFVTTSGNFQFDRDDPELRA